MQNKTGFVLSSKSWGGLELNVLKLAQWLAIRGWDMTLFVTSGSRMQKEAKGFPGKVVVIPLHRKYFSLIKAWRFSRTLKKEGITDVLISHTRDIDFMFWAKLFSGGKIRVAYQQQMQLGVAKRDLLHTMRFSGLNFWISPLECLKEQVKEKTRCAPEKIHVIPLGIDVSQFIQHKYTRDEAREKLKLKPKSILIGIMGRIDPLKGQYFLVKALHELHRRNIEAELLITGEPTLHEKRSADYYTELQKFVREHDLSDKVHIRGFTNDVSLFYNSIDVFALASEAETYGMVTIEAMLSQLPVVGTNRGGTPEILNFGELGLLYEPNDLTDFCSKLEWLIAHPEHAAEMAQKASKSAAERFSHTKECELIEKMMG